MQNLHQGKVLYCVIYTVCCIIPSYSWKNSHKYRKSCLNYWYLLHVGYIYHQRPLGDFWIYFCKIACDNFCLSLSKLSEQQTNYILLLVTFQGICGIQNFTKFSRFPSKRSIIDFRRIWKIRGTFFFVCIISSWFDVFWLRPVKWNLLILHQFLWDLLKNIFLIFSYIWFEDCHSASWFSRGHL